MRRVPHVRFRCEAQPAQAAVQADPGGVLSKAVQIDLEQCTCSRVKVIGTTAFTNKPVSMKYRGLFEVHNRGESYINYFGQAGRWSLEEGFQWWKANHSTK